MNMIKIYTLATMSLILSIMMSLNESMMIMWIQMEMSNIMFLMMFTLMQNNINTPAMLMLIQFFSSSLILMSIIENSHILMTLGILVKLGMYPAHMWLPMVVFMSTWKMNMFMMTLPKIPPFLFMESLSNYKIMLTLTIMTTIMMTMKLTQNNNMKIIMSMSSIIHSSWMVLAQSINFNCWLTYFLSYSINTFMMCEILSKKMNSMIYNNTTMKIILMMMMFSMMSMPPITMFIGKMYLITLSNYMLMLPLIILTASSMISILFYSRIFIKTMYMYKHTTKIKLLNNMKIKMTWMMFMMMLLIII